MKVHYFCQERFDYVPSGELNVGGAKDYPPDGGSYVLISLRDPTLSAISGVPRAGEIRLTRDQVDELIGLLQSRRDSWLKR